METIRFLSGVVNFSGETVMKLESAIRIPAGTLVLPGLALSYFVNPWWQLLPVFVGVNLIQSAFTGFCPAEIVLKKMGVGRKSDCCCCG